MRPITAALLALLSLLSPGCAAPVAARQGAPDHVVGAATAPAATALAPFPPPGSEEGKADLAIVLWLQRTRTAADVARARAEVEVGLETFAEALGPGFDAVAHPRTRALLGEVGERTRRAVGEEKRRFRRPRPYDADPRVSPAVDRERSFSYPSGHAARGVVFARILAELAPARREALVEVGLRVGHDRVVGGVHYPSDVTAGQRLGDALAAALLAEPDVRRGVDAVRVAEWGGGTRPPPPARPGDARGSPAP